MKKPKYKLGDILHDPKSGTYEVIKAVKPVGHHYRYLVIEIANSPTHYDGQEVSWFEEIIDKYTIVVGNVFDKR